MNNETNKTKKCSHFSHFVAIEMNKGKINKNANNNNNDNNLQTGQAIYNKKNVAKWNCTNKQKFLLHFSKIMDTNIRIMLSHLLWIRFVWYYYLVSFFLVLFH